MRLAPDGSPLRSGCSAFPGSMFHGWSSLGGACLSNWVAYLGCQRNSKSLTTNHYGVPSGRCDAVPGPSCWWSDCQCRGTTTACQANAEGEEEKTTQNPLTIPSGHVGTHMRS